MHPGLPFNYSAPADSALAGLIIDSDKVEAAGDVTIAVSLAAGAALAEQQVLQIVVLDGTIGGTFRLTPPTLLGEGLTPPFDFIVNGVALDRALTTQVGGTTAATIPWTSPLRLTLSARTDGAADAAAPGVAQGPLSTDPTVTTLSGIGSGSATTGDAGGTGSELQDDADAALADFPLHAAVAGLGAGQTVTVREAHLGAAFDLTVGDAAVATFGMTLARGVTPSVSVVAQPANMSCRVLNVPVAASAAQAIMVGCSSVRQIVAGPDQSCARFGDGTASCWGSNIYGKLGYGDLLARSFASATPLNFGLGRTVLQLTISTYHACARLDNGAVKCWGLNNLGQLGLGDTVQRSEPPATPIDLGAGRIALELAGGLSHTCARLDNGTVKCWGINSSGQLGVGDTATRLQPDATPVNLGPGRTAVQLAAGGHTCAILDNGSLKCWGFNGYGELGVGDLTRRTSPDAAAINLGAGRTAAEVVVGDYFTCARLDDATVKCWGQNSSGTLATGDTTQTTAPGSATVNFGPSRHALSLAAGSNFACARLDDGSIKCWGDNNYGQHGTGDFATKLAPGTPADLGAGRSAVDLTAGATHACARLDDGTVKCWGSNIFGELGIGDTSRRLSPGLAAVDVGPGRTAVEVASGAGHTCARLDNGTVKCWGANSGGQAGIGTTTPAINTAPTAAVSLGRPAIGLAVNADGTYACARLDDATAKCWGQNASGQFGLGDTAARSAPAATPIDVGSGRTIVDLVAGNLHVCARLDDGSVKCWGGNGYGQLGLGDTAQRTAPAAAAIDFGGGRTAVQVTAGTIHTCARLSDGTATCWGGNFGGQLGLGDTTQRSAPGPAAIDFGAGRTAVKLSASAFHTCAVLDDGAVKCWGNGGNGVLGLSDTLQRSAPSTAINFGTSRRAVDVSSGPFHVCALFEDGTVRCWGWNGNGQIGLGDTVAHFTPESRPINFGAGRTAASISVGRDHTCALLDNGQVKCWGFNVSGQLGLGLAANAPIPSAVSFPFKNASLQLNEAGTPAIFLGNFPAARDVSYGAVPYPFFLWPSRHDRGSLDLFYSSDLAAPCSASGLTSWSALATGIGLGQARYDADLTPLVPGEYRFCARFSVAGKAAFARGDGVLFVSNRCGAGNGFQGVATSLGVCQCPAGSSFDGKECAANNSGQVCGAGYGFSGAFNTSGICQCAVPAYLEGTSCVHGSFGSPCGGGFGHAGTFDRAGACQCPAGSALSGANCAASNAGQACGSGYGVSGTYDNWGACQCPAGASFDGTYCSRAGNSCGGGPGNTGTTDIAGVCQCPGGVTFDGVTCPLVPGQSCGGNYGYLGTADNFGVCVCPSGSSFDGANCSSNGLSCGSGMGFIGSMDYYGTCQCPAGSSLQGSYCLGNPGVSCGGGFGYPGMYGGGGTCQCPAGAMFNGTDCSAAGASCGSGSYGVYGTTDDFGTCTCPTSWSYSGTECVYSTAGQSCGSGYGNAGLFDNYGACQCPSGSGLTNGECSVAGAGGPCGGQYGNAGVISADGSCQCPSGSTLYNGSFCSVSNQGQSCGGAYGNPGTVDETGGCVCSGGATFDGTNCSAPSYGGSCGGGYGNPGTFRFDGTCECGSGATFDGSNCSAANANGPCGGDWGNPGTYDGTGTCVCPSGSSLSGAICTAANYGQSCGTGAGFPAPGTFDMTGACQCASGSVLSGNDCVSTNAGQTCGGGLGVDGTIDAAGNCQCPNGISNGDCLP